MSCNYILAVMCLLLVGCPFPGSRPPSFPANATLVSRSVGNFSGTELRIDTLARRLLVGAETTPAGYAYYCYLLFADRQKDTAPARRAVALAYLSLLNDVVEATKDTKVLPEQMAMLLTLMTSDGDAGKVLRTKDPQAFLDGYNYGRARGIADLLQRAKVVLPSISIIGVPRPIESDQVPTGEIAVLDLTIEDEARAQDVLATLKASLDSGEKEIMDSKEPVVLGKVRQALSKVGAKNVVLGNP